MRQFCGLLKNSLSDFFKTSLELTRRFDSMNMLSIMRVHEDLIIGEPDKGEQ